MSDYQAAIPGGTLAVTGGIAGIEGIAVAGALILLGSLLLRIGFRRKQAMGQ